MTKHKLVLEEIYSYTIKELANKLRSIPKPYDIEIPLSSIGVTNNNIDIASDYAWALFAGEELYKICSSVKMGFNQDKHQYAIVFSVEPENIDKLAAKLLWLAKGFEDFEDEDFSEAGNDFEASLLSFPVVHFPELADSFMANYLPWVEWQIEDEEREKLYKEHPTWRYHFWKSFASQQFGVDLYSSPYAWIVPSPFDVRLLLPFLGWESNKNEIHLKDAFTFRINNEPLVLVGQEAVVHLPYYCMNKAIECWWWGLKYTGKKQFEGSIKSLERYEQKSGLQLVDGLEFRDYLSEQEFQWYMSNDGSIVVAELEQVKFLLFPDVGDKVSQSTLTSYFSIVEETHAKLKDILGFNRLVHLNWELFDDEKFEELCYDILSRCDRFDSSSIRKMGKSRSRDGGRDIEIWTRRRYGKPSEKWIYQCKFSSKTDSSLSGSKITISDVIDQYEADGFGIMTNLVIDSTLYDKLDGIRQTRKNKGIPVGIDTRDKYELDRFISFRKDLLTKFFKAQKEVES